MNEPDYQPSDSPDKDRYGNKDEKYYLKFGSCQVENN